MNTKDTQRSTRTRIETVAVAKHGVLTDIAKCYVYAPKTNFGGGTVKWFDDTKLVKGGVR